MLPLKIFTEMPILVLDDCSSNLKKKRVLNIRAQKNTG